MSELVFENLVGRRELKGEFEAVVIAEVTKGNFRISPKVSEQLGVTDGSFITMQKAGDVIYIGKGKDGVAKQDENGNYELDNRGHRVYSEEGFGALAREVNPGSGLLKCSIASAWSAIGGSTEVKKVYELGEGVDQTLNTGKGTFATTLYPLIFVREEAKAERIGVAKEENTSDAQAPQTDAVQEDAAFEDENF